MRSVPLNYHPSGLDPLSVIPYRSILSEGMVFAGRPHPPLHPRLILLHPLLSTPARFRYNHHQQATHHPIHLGPESKNGPYPPFEHPPLHERHFARHTYELQSHLPLGFSLSTPTYLYLFSFSLHRNHTNFTATIHPLSSFFVYSLFSYYVVYQSPTIYRSALHTTLRMGQAWSPDMVVLYRNNLS